MKKLFYSLLIIISLLFASCTECDHQYTIDENYIEFCEVHCTKCGVHKVLSTKDLINYAKDHDDTSLILDIAISQFKTSIIL